MIWYVMYAEGRAAKDCQQLERNDPQHVSVLMLPSPSSLLSHVKR